MYHNFKNNPILESFLTIIITAISDLSKAQRVRSKSVSEAEPEKKVMVGQNLIDKENLEVGGVSWKVYSYYAKSVGYFSTFSSILFYCAYQGFQVRSFIRMC